MSTGEDSGDDEGLVAKVGGAARWLFGDDPKDEKGANTERGGKTPLPTVTRPSGPQPTVSSTVRPGTPDPAIRKVLEADVKAAALPAYQAYLTLDASMAHVITDQSMRIRAVLAALASQGHNLAAVDKDIAECLEALERQLGEADDAAKRKLGERVLVKQQRILVIDAELGRLNDERTQLAGEADRARVEIENRRSSFEATVADYKAELAKARDNINRNGKGG